jgi:TetR/AcrR family transcriptional regulator, regulator of autoinduction and epiphytic fitness
MTRPRVTVPEREGCPVTEAHRRPDPRIAETQRLVKATTLELIAEVGFEGTTIELISERSGVSRSTIYRHWPNPADLYLAAFDPPPADEGPPAPSADVLADLRHYIQYVADRLNDERFAAALCAQLDKARRDVAYRDAHLQYAVERNEHGVAIFRRGVEQGTFRASLDPTHETDLILAFLVYQRLHRYRHLDAAIVGGLFAEVRARCLPA